MMNIKLSLPTSKWSSLAFPVENERKGRGRIEIDQAQLTKYCVANKGQRFYSRIQH